MAVYVSNITIPCGADFKQTFTLEDSNGMPLDLSSYTALAELKKHSASLRRTATFSVSFPDAINGKLSISLGSTITSSIRPGRYGYDILIDNGTIRTRVVEGSALVTSGITSTSSSSESSGGTGSQGSAGAQGAQGSVGAQGAQGSVGAQGAQGSVGSQGAQGNTGSQGAQGDVGSQGPPGGSEGAQGSTGAQGDIGPQGAQGDIGPQGAQGDQGIQGDSQWISISAGIHTSSNVGVGTTNPQYKLDIGGDINFTGSLYQNGNSLFTSPRISISQSTEVLGIGSTANITFSNGIPKYSLLKVTTSDGAWVTIYTDTDSRTNDSSRSIDTDPIPGSGVIAETISTGTGISTQRFTPGVIGYNDEDPVSGSIYVKVQNNSGISTNINITLTITN